MWFIHGAGSAEDPPTAEQVMQWQRMMAPPENELPASASTSVLLNRTDDAAVGITQLEVFSTGFRFTLAVRVRRARPEFAVGGLFMLLSPHPQPGIEIPLANRLLLGIEYPDGRRASTLEVPGGEGAGAMTGNQPLVLVTQGGGGGELSVDQTFWVAPLPPEGPVAVILTWPSFGMDESRTILDGAAIRAAASRSTLLWPPQAAPEPAQPLPAPPRPETGWFALPPS